MSVTLDIVQSWRRPRTVVRKLLERGGSEVFLLTLLMIFLVLAFAAALPNLARQANLGPEVPLVQRLYAAAMGLLATIPVWYVLAALSHLVMRAFGGQGSFPGARLALFWALVAISPAMLVHGLVLGLAGSSSFTALFGGAVALGFLVFWILMLREVER
jgi:hypothetical protein